MRSRQKREKTNRALASKRIYAAHEIDRLKVFLLNAPYRHFYKKPKILLFGPRGSRVDDILHRRGC